MKGVAASSVAVSRNPSVSKSDVLEANKKRLQKEESKNKSLVIKENPSSEVPLPLMKQPSQMLIELTSRAY